LSRDKICHFRMDTWCEYPRDMNRELQDVNLQKGPVFLDPKSKIQNRNNAPC
jgi:hypothetical protein